MTTAQLTKLSRRSRSRGHTFETQLLKRFTALGYKAQRKVLSGANLKVPYDILVSPYRLKIEAKRTLKDYIVLQGKWLRKMNPKLVLAFAVGNYAGRKLRIFVLDLWSLQDVTPDVVIQIQSVSRKIYQKELEEWADHQRIVQVVYNERKFCVKPLERFMSMVYPH